MFTDELSVATSSLLRRKFMMMKSLFNALCLQKRHPYSRRNENGRAAGFWVSLGEDLQAVSGGQDYQRRSDQRPVQHYCV